MYRYQINTYAKMSTGDPYVKTPLPLLIKDMTTQRDVVSNNEGEYLYETESPTITLWRPSSLFCHMVGSIQTVQGEENRLVTANVYMAHFRHALPYTVPEGVCYKPWFEVTDTASGHKYVSEQEGFIYLHAESYDTPLSIQPLYDDDLPEDTPSPTQTFAEWVEAPSYPVLTGLSEVTLTFSPAEPESRATLPGTLICYTPTDGPIFFSHRTGLTDETTVTAYIRGSAGTFRILYGSVAEEEVYTGTETEYALEIDYTQADTPTPFTGTLRFLDRTLTPIVGLEILANQTNCVSDTDGEITLPEISAPYVIHFTFHGAQHEVTLHNAQPVYVFLDPADPVSPSLYQLSGVPRAITKTKEYYRERYAYELLCAEIYIKKREMCGHDFLTKNRYQEKPYKTYAELIEAFELLVKKDKVSMEDAPLLYNLFRIDLSETGNYVPEVYKDRMFIQHFTSDVPYNLSKKPVLEHNRYKALYTENYGLFDTRLRGEILSTQTGSRNALLVEDLRQKYALTAKLISEYGIRMIHLLPRGTTTFPLSQTLASYPFLGALSTLAQHKNLIREVSSYGNLPEEEAYTLSEFKKYGNSATDVSSRVTVQSTDLEALRLFMKSNPGGFAAALSEVLTANYNDSQSASFTEGLELIREGSFGEKAMAVAKVLSQMDGDNRLHTWTREFVEVDTSNDGCADTYTLLGSFIPYADHYVLYHTDTNWDLIRKLQYYMLQSELPNTGIYYLRQAMLVDYKIAPTLTDHYYNFGSVEMDLLLSAGFYDFYREMKTGMYVLVKDRQGEAKLLEDKIRKAYTVLSEKMTKLEESLLLSRAEYLSLGHADSLFFLNWVAFELKKKYGVAFLTAQSLSLREEILSYLPTLKKTFMSYIRLDSVKRQAITEEIEQYFSSGSFTESPNLSSSSSTPTRPYRNLKYQAGHSPYKRNPVETSQDTKARVAAATILQYADNNRNRMSNMASEYEDDESKYTVQQAVDTVIYAGNMVESMNGYDRMQKIVGTLSPEELGIVDAVAVDEKKNMYESFLYQVASNFGENFTDRLEKLGGCNSWIDAFIVVGEIASETLLYVSQLLRKDTTIISGVGCCLLRMMGMEEKYNEFAELEIRERFQTVRESLGAVNEFLGFCSKVTSAVRGGFSFLQELITTIINTMKAVLIALLKALAALIVDRITPWLQKLTGFSMTDFVRETMGESSGKIVMASPVFMNTTMGGLVDSFLISGGTTQTVSDVLGEESTVLYDASLAANITPSSLAGCLPMFNMLSDVMSSGTYVIVNSLSDVIGKIFSFLASEINFETPSFVVKIDKIISVLKNFSQSFYTMAGSAESLIMAMHNCQDRDLAKERPLDALLDKLISSGAVQLTASQKRTYDYIKNPRQYYQEILAKYMPNTKKLLSNLNNKALELNAENLNRAQTQASSYQNELKVDILQNAFLAKR